jgi:predicted O-methyltransferase YrrM
VFIDSAKAYYQAFFWVLIDLIVELLGLIIKPFDNQTES